MAKKSYQFEEAVKELQRRADRARELGAELDKRVADLLSPALSNKQLGINADNVYQRLREFETEINDIENYIRNINFSALARCCADLREEGRSSRKESAS